MAIDNQNRLLCTAQHTPYISETARYLTVHRFYRFHRFPFTCTEGVEINTYGNMNEEMKSSQRNGLDVKKDFCRENFVMRLTEYEIRN